MKRLKCNVKLVQNTIGFNFGAYHNISEHVQHDILLKLEPQCLPEQFVDGMRDVMHERTILIENWTLWIILKLLFEVFQTKMSTKIVLCSCVVLCVVLDARNERHSQF